MNLNERKVAAVLFGNTVINFFLCSWPRTALKEVQRTRVVLKKATARQPTVDAKFLTSPGCAQVDG